MELQYWQTSQDPGAMLKFLSKVRTDNAMSKKLRLFMAECCRQIWDFLPEGPMGSSRHAVEIAERYAHGLCNENDLGEAYAVESSLINISASAENPWEECSRTVSNGGDKPLFPAAITRAPVRDCLEPDTKHFGNPFIIAKNAAGRVVDIAQRALQINVLPCEAAQSIYMEQAELLRQMFRHPKEERINIKPEWLKWNDGIIPKIAAAIAQERRPEDMPILADALEEAGCTNQAMLDFCRSERVITPYNWVVEDILQQAKVKEKPQHRRHGGTGQAL